MIWRLKGFVLPSREDQQFLRMPLSSQIGLLLNLASALTYCHEELTPRLAHCDVRPENILHFNYHKGDFRLADFGAAVEVDSCGHAHLDG